ncbi:MAG: hypothetical protein E7378_04450 [Clostridiales bacterium]|nr:hypothetical protein [Clostridiales bacterium]
MKKKFSLLLNIATICLCVCAIAIGVWSAKRAELAVSGNIGFTANNCDVVVTTHLENAIRWDDTANDWEQVSEDETWTTADANAAITKADYIADGDTWNFGQINFDDWFLEENAQVKPIRLVVDIQNYSNFPVHAIVTSLTYGDNDTPVLTKDKNAYMVQQSGTYMCEIAAHNVACILPGTKSAEGVITPSEGQLNIVLTLYNDATAFDLNDMSINIEFSQTEIPEASDNFVYYSVLDGFDLDGNELPEDKFMIVPDEGGDKTGTLIGVPAGTGHLIIPSYVMVGGEVYEITGVSGSYYDDPSLGVGMYNFNNYTYVTLPNSIGFIDNGAFYCGYGGSSNLSNVVIPEGVTIISNAAFYYSGLLWLTLPSTITHIGTMAFQETDSLKEIYIPDGVTEMGVAAFFYTGLNSIHIPGSLSALGECVLEDSEDINYITVASDNEYYDSRGNCNAIIKTEENILIKASNNTTFVPEGIVAIGEAAFRNLKSITTVTLPSSLTSIGEIAFDACDSLETIKFNGTEEQWNAIEGIDELSNYDYEIVFLR